MGLSCLLLAGKIKNRHTHPQKEKKSGEAQAEQGSSLGIATPRSPAWTSPQQMNIESRGEPRARTQTSMFLTCQPAMCRHMTGEENGENSSISSAHAVHRASSLSKLAGDHAFFHSNTQHISHTHTCFLPCTPLSLSIYQQPLLFHLCYLAFITSSQLAPVTGQNTYPLLFSSFLLSRSIHSPGRIS